jgi:hypothetical protein
LRHTLGAVDRWRESLFWERAFREPSNGVRLADAGHEVTLVARGRRADELRTSGAIIEHALTGRNRVRQLPVIEEITPALDSDFCLVTVRREQLDSVLPRLKMAHRIRRAACHFGLVLAAFDRLATGRILFRLSHAPRR